MASSLWTKAWRACVHLSRSTPTCQAPITLVSRKNVALPLQSILSRHEHSLASKTTEEGYSGSSPPAFPSKSPPVAYAEPELPTFDSLKGIIAYPTWKAITQAPFHLKTMSHVQAAVLPLLPRIAQPWVEEPPLDGVPRPPRDLLVRAKTGTGKTLAFLIPAMEARLDAIKAFAKKAVEDAGRTSDQYLEGRAARTFAREHVGTLIISPTRELATQIANEATKLGQHHKDMDVQLLVGGESKRHQIRQWMRARRDIVVGTPGRLRDLLTSETDFANGVAKTKLLVLDEADTLLDMGFRDDIDAIKEFLPPTPERQTFLFSATVSRNIQQIARSTLDKNHLFINTVTDDASPVHAHVKQYHTVLPNAGQQIPHILRLLAHDQLSNPGKSKIILFLPTTKMTQLFASFLRDLARATLPAGRQTKIYEIHSKRTQQARTNTSHTFRHDRSGSAVLVTSDVSARGIDYPGVTRVIQVGIPGSSEQYVHRVGRTGRAGTEGRGDLVLLPWEIGFVTWQLTEMPLKPLTVNELTSQVNELAGKYDADYGPKSDLEATSKRDHRNRDGAHTTTSLAGGSLISTIDRMNQTVLDFLANLGEAEINETFASLLGYYLSKAQELRLQKSAIVQGCKDWATEACGLPVPPYVSEMFLQKLGVYDDQKRSFRMPSRGRDRDRDRDRPGKSWEGRGQQRFKGRQQQSKWAYSEDGERGSRSEEYRPSRFHSKTPREDSGLEFESKKGYGYGGSGMRQRKEESFDGRDKRNSYENRWSGRGHRGGSRR